MVGKQKSKRAREQRTGERGQVLAWVAILLPLLLALLGLVFDGGLMWVQYRRARWAADGAAVAAASEIDPVRFLEEGQVVLGDNAVPTAIHYAQTNNPHLHITDVYVLDNVVYVRGWVQTETVFLSMFGVGGLRLNILGRERPAWGVSRTGQ